jgi:hypothetical protein
MAMAIVLGYGGGALNTLISFTLDGRDILKLAFVEEYWLSFTLGNIIAIAGVLHVVGRFHNTSALLPNFDLCADKKNRALLLISVIFGATILLLFTGEIGFMRDTRFSGFANISVKATLINILILPVGILVFYLGLKEQSKVLKYTLMLVAAILLIITVGFGRRIFIFSALIYLMVFFGKNDSNKLLTFKNLAILVFIIILSNVATTTFSLMRITKNSISNTSTNSIIELVPKTIENYQESERLNLDETIHKNLSSRGFVLNYLALLVEASFKYEPLYGEGFKNALIVSTPGILYPSKYKNIFVNEDKLFFNHFRISDVKDGASSILTAGIGDFGMYGLIAYPLILCIFFSTLLKALNRLLSPVKYLFISIISCYAFISLEQDIAGYLSTLRNFPLILFILWLFLDFKRPPPFTNDVKNNLNIMNIK